MLVYNWFQLSQIGQKGNLYTTVTSRKTITDEISFQVWAQDNNTFRMTKTSLKIGS